MTKLFVKKYTGMKTFKFILLDTAMFNYEKYVAEFNKGWKTKDAPLRFEAWLKSGELK